MTIEFGNLKKVNIREIWPHEALDFTPWLADNLDKLSATLGMDLEMTQREALVGGYSLDLLSRDLSTGHTVVIENQFGDTNHDHLGKLITYAAGFDAGSVVWISERIREEHRQAIEYLNQRTDTETNFFAIELEVFRIDTSRPVINFKLISSPNDWHKSKKQPKDGSTPRAEAYRNFFQILVDEMRTKHSFTKAKEGQPQNWYSFPTGFSGLTYGAVFSLGGRLRTELYIDLLNVEKNKNMFDWLFSQKDIIEGTLGEQLTWERLDEKRASRIALYRNGSIDDVAQYGEFHSWLIQHLLNFRKIFTPLLKQYKQQYGL